MLYTPKSSASSALTTEDETSGQIQPQARVRARSVIPGRTMKITRKCLEGRFFFAPDERDGDKVRDFVGYCLAHVARECGVLVHSCVVMSNHIHLDVTDPHGKIASFKQRLFSLLARGVNRLRGRKDTFWSGDEGCVTLRPRAEQTFGDIVYTLCNPVQDGLVRRGDLWPGFTTYGWRFGETRTFSRPKGFFNPAGDMPETVSLTLARPPLFLDASDDQLFELLMDAVDTRERQLRDEQHRAQKRFVGVANIRRQSWTCASNPTDVARPKPSVATSDRRLLRDELVREAGWRREYARARAELLAGRESMFPFGTDWMHRYAGVRVAAPPPP